jgi:hypothetical protein
MEISYHGYMSVDVQIFLTIINFTITYNIICYYVIDEREDGHDRSEWTGPYDGIRQLCLPGTENLAILQTVSGTRTGERQGRPAPSAPVLSSSNRQSAQLGHNIHVRDGVSEGSFVKMREARDRTLSMRASSCRRFRSTRARDTCLNRTKAERPF